MVGHFQTAELGQILSARRGVAVLLLDQYEMQSVVRSESLAYQGQLSVAQFIYRQLRREYLFNRHAAGVERSLFSSEVMWLPTYLFT